MIFSRGRVVIVLVALALAAGCAGEETGEALAPDRTAADGAAQPDPRTEVLAFRDEHLTALIDQRDMDRIMSHYAEDAAYVPPGEAPLVGQEAIRGYLEDFFAEALVGVDFENHEVLVDGDLAVLRDTYEAVVIRHSGAGQSQHAGEDVWVLRRIDGQWRIGTVVWTERTPRAQEETE